MVVLSLIVTLALGAVATQNASQVAADLNRQALAALRSRKGENPPGPCTVDTAYRRKEWSALTVDERRNYTSAVKCLFDSPSLADPNWFPNSRSRHDDFVAVHVSQTLFIHSTGNFLTWHRHFLYAYEKALREECGYAGYSPYWDWFGYTGDLTQTTLFDGSDASLGGDGVFVEHEGTYISLANITLPHGNGGGCITTGPFANVTLNIGPIAPAQTNLEAVNITDYNPRCLRRDLSSYANNKWMTTANLQNITTGTASASIQLFQDELQGRDLSDPEFLGMHASGHYTMAGDGSCFFSSTNEPLFFLHHAQVDRMYWMWQALHPDEAGTVAGLREPGDPSAGETELSDLIWFGGNMPVENRTIGETIDTLKVDYCYVYE